MKESARNNEELEEKIKQVEREKIAKENEVNELNGVIEGKEAEIDKHSNKAKKLAELNEELR